MPTRVELGAGKVREVGRLASRYGRRALLVTGRTASKSLAERFNVRELLEDAGVEVVPFHEVEENPSDKTVDRWAELARREGCDIVVALGGGSPLDAGKAIALAATNGPPVARFVRTWTRPEERPEREALPIIAIPTTAGTGSEVTPYAVLTVDVGKRPLISHHIYPRVAIVDPELTYTMPPNLTAATGMDALSHAIEAYIAKRSNPLSRMFSVEAGRIILRELPRAVKAPDPSSRAAMAYASMLAGVAIAQAGTAVVHGLSYVLTTDFGIHHGMALALLLPPTLKVLSDRCGDRILGFARCVGVDAGSAEEFAEFLGDFVRSLVGERRLRDWGVTEERVKYMVEVSQGSRGNIENTPGGFSPSDAERVYRELL